MAVVLGLFLEHLAVADDGVERRAQLVAHVGQECALGLIGLVGLLLRLLDPDVAFLQLLGARPDLVLHGLVHLAEVGRHVSGWRKASCRVSSLPGDLDLGVQVARGHLKRDIGGMTDRARDRAGDSQADDDHRKHDHAGRREWRRPVLVHQGERLALILLHHDSPTERWECTSTRRAPESRDSRRRPVASLASRRLALRIDAAADGDLRRKAADLS